MLGGMKNSEKRCPRHPDKPVYASDLCKNCYNKKYKKTPNKVMAWACEHTDRPHSSQGLCHSCYSGQQYKTNSVKAWACEHTDRPHSGNGLCRPCYGKNLKKTTLIQCEHTHRPVIARGLCWSCYFKARDPSGEKLKAQTLRRNLKRYDLTPQTRNDLEAIQEGVCAICRQYPQGDNYRTNTLHVDHIDGTKTVRGLLCNNCNNGLGRFLHNPAWLREAADYLENPVTSRPPYLAYLLQKEEA